MAQTSEQGERPQKYREQADGQSHKTSACSFPCCPGGRRQVRGEGTWGGAEHTLTISVDSYPSPPGNPGRKKEQIQIKPPGMPPRKGSRPHARLKEIEVKPLFPEDLPLPEVALSQGEPRDTLYSA